MSSPPPLKDLVARRVALYRERKGLSQEALAAAVTELGYEMGRLAIHRIETRARNVSLEETLLLAAALDVPPLLLFVPLGDAPWMAVGNREFHPEFVRKWVIGEEQFGRPLDPDNPRGRGLAAHGDGDLWNRNSYTAAAFARLSDLIVQMQRVQGVLTANLVASGLLPQTEWNEPPHPFLTAWALADQAPAALGQQVERALREMAGEITMMQRNGLTVHRHLLAEGWAEGMALVDPKFTLNEDQEVEA